MSEKSPLLAEYQKSFGPRERAIGIMSVALEYTEQVANLPPEDYKKFENWLEALKVQLTVDNSDETLILGFATDIKNVLLSLGCSPERFTDQNLIHILNTQKKVLQQTGEIEEYEEDEDPFGPPKKKEYKN